MKLEPGRKALNGRGIRFLSLAAAAVLAALTGCRSAESGGDGAGSSTQAVQGKGAAQLWAQNCMQCHNNRSPASYSDAEWDVATQHMRFRANLTAEEYRRILEFLKAGN